MLDPTSSRLDEVEAALNDYQRAGYQLGITAQFVLLSSALLLRNQAQEALQAIDHGLSVVGRNNERFLESELYRLKARALVTGGASQSEAEASLAQALQTAQSQQARSLELRVATDLAKLWMSQGKRFEAFKLLDGTCTRLGAGLDMQDFQNAKKVLKEVIYQ
jgi:hypothetical protein